MKYFFKILGGMAQYFYGIIALILTLFILFLLGTQGVIFWLNTEKGGEWLSVKINTELQDSGYQMVLDGLSLSGITGLKIAKMEILQNDLSLISSKDLSFSINPFPLGLKTLDISLKAESINLSSLSESHESQNKTVMIVPDLFFSKANIELDIQNLLISENIIAGGFASRLKAKQAISLVSGIISLQGLTKFIDTKHNQALYLPKKITNKIQIYSADQKIVFKEIVTENENYKLTSSGFYTLTDKNFELGIEGQWLNLGQITSYLKNSRAIKPIRLKGDFAGHIDDFFGELSAKTAYKDIQASIESRIERKAKIITISDIKGRGGLLGLNGNIEYNLASGFANGQIKAELSDAKFLNNFINNFDLSGNLTAFLKLQEQNGKQSAFVSADLKDTVYKNFMAKKISADIKLNDIYDTKNITADIKLGNGRVANIDIENADLTITNAENNYKLALNGKGYSVNPFSFYFNVLLEQTGHLKIKILKSELKTGQGFVTAQGDITEDILDLQITAHDLVPEQIAFIDMGGLPIFLDKLTADIKGSMTRPVIIASYEFGSTIKDHNYATFEGKSSLVSGSLTNNLKGKGKNIKEFHVNFDMPVKLSFKPFEFEMNRDATLIGDANIQSDLQAISSLFLDDGYNASGELTINTKISGTLRKPLLNGKAELKQASFIDMYNDIKLTNIEGLLSFDGDRIEINSITANDEQKQGKLEIKGNIELDKISRPDIDASMVMKGMNIIKNDNFDMRVNADLNLETISGGYLISGTISPQELSIYLSDQFQEKIPKLNIVESASSAKPSYNLFSQTELDIKLKADNKIFISGRGLNAELQGELDVTGKLDEPIVTGNLNSLRGSYEEFGRRFILDKADLRFQGTIPPSPYMDVESSSQIDDITVKVLIKNNIESPQIKLVSVPSLPEDEILSLILFGTDIKKISPFQAIKLADTLRRFSGQGGTQSFDPLRQIQSATGLDDISIKGIGSENVTVGAGKYISDKVYIEVEKGTVESSGAVSVDINVTPNISVESEATQNGESNVGVFWEWDY